MPRIDRIYLHPDIFFYLEYIVCVQIICLFLGGNKVLSKYSITKNVIKKTQNKTTTLYSISILYLKYIFSLPNFNFMQNSVIQFGVKRQREEEEEEEEEQEEVDPHCWKA